ncbi:MAG TPA: DUF2520 domain-containing protein [Puia sp.]|nr:DUF2520 domain-containing protein [Puia sp.]
MKVVILGSGNVATALGRRIVAAGHPVTQVAGRNREAVMRLADEWRAGHATGWETVDPTADLYIAALTDSAIRDLPGKLSLPGRLVLHTAGALSAGTLAAVTDRPGVLYPLQSFRTGIALPTLFPLLIDAVRPEDLPIIREFAETLSPQVVRADDAERLKLHVAAVLVNNFTNHLYTLASDFCTREQVDFNLLFPLIRETAGRVEHYPPQQVQTGPALRGDAVTIRKHEEALAGYKDTGRLYGLFTTLIEAYYRSPEIPPRQTGI